jgi:hypothetical protein
MAAAFRTSPEEIDRWLEEPVTPMRKRVLDAQPTADQSGVHRMPSLGGVERKLPFRGPNRNLHKMR